MLRIVSTLLLALSLFSLCSARRPNPNDHDRNTVELDELISSLPEGSVKAALRDSLAPKYRDGVFEGDRRAIETLRLESPQLATKIVEHALYMEAVKDALRRRQNNNATSSDQPTTSSAEPTQSSDASSDESTPTPTPSSSEPAPTSDEPTPTSSSPDDASSTRDASSSANGGNTPPPDASSSTVVNRPPSEDSSTPGQYTPQGSTSEILPGNTTASFESNASRLSARTSTSSDQYVPERTQTTIEEIVLVHSFSSSASHTMVLSQPGSERADEASGLNSSEPLITSFKPSSQFAVDMSSSVALTTAIIVPTVITTTNDGGNTVVRSTSIAQSAAPTTVRTQITTTNSDGEDVTTSANVPATVIRTTNNGGNTITRTSVLSQATFGNGRPIQPQTTTDRNGNTVVISPTRPGQVITTTNDEGDTVTVRYTPPGSVVSQVITRTTVLPNGGTSTLTSYAIVGGQNTVIATGTGGPGDPGLQSGSPAQTAKYGVKLAALLGVAIGVAAMM